MKLSKYIIATFIFLFIISNINCSSSKETSDIETKEGNLSGSKQVNVVTKSPILFVGNEKYIFKDVEEGTYVEYEWELKNIGTDTLYISDIESSCGCTAAIPDTKVIPPEKSTKLKVKLDTHGRIGINTKFITIISNDSKSPNKVLTLEGRVIPKRPK